MTIPAGPYETDREVLAEPAVRAVYEAAHVGGERMALGNHRMLAAAATEAGVQLGGYDDRILWWLAGWEPQMCAVVAGLITRAAAGRLAGDQLATVLDALDLAADELRDRAANCGDCDAHPAGLCTTCEHRLARAEGFEQTTAALRGQR